MQKEDCGKLNASGFYFSSRVLNNSINYLPLSKLLKFRLRDSCVEIVTPEGSVLILENQETSFMKWFVLAGNRILANLKGTDLETNVWDMVSDINKSTSDTINSNESNSPADNQTNANNKVSESVEIGNSGISKRTTSPMKRIKTLESYNRNDTVSQIDKPNETYCNWNVNNKLDSVVLIMEEPSLSTSDYKSYLWKWHTRFAFMVFGSILLLALGWYTLDSKWYISSDYGPGSHYVTLYIPLLAIFMLIFVGGLVLTYITIFFLVKFIYLRLKKLLYEVKTQQLSITAEKTILKIIGSSKPSKVFNMVNFAYMEIQKYKPGYEAKPTLSQSESCLSSLDQYLIGDYLTSFKFDENDIHYQIVLFNNEECEIFSFNNLNKAEAYWLAGMIMPVLSK